jgi:hypothetical protein
MKVLPDVHNPLIYKKNAPSYGPPTFAMANLRHFFVRQDNGGYLDV